MSSASIVTFVWSSPFHQPAGVLEGEQVLAGALERALRVACVADATLLRPRSPSQHASRSPTATASPSPLTPAERIAI